MAESKKLNIYKKIQKARVDLKKIGYNKYSNYKYFELGDFLPHINYICNEIGLYTEFSYEEKLATLTIYNTENLDEKRKWTTPVEVATLKGCSTIQNIIGTQRFARRYLYNDVF
ncbi:ERF family protein [Clostridium perfringens]|uniref:ERF family protein n=1 Tax=Clostridium perfringens TaxID=1502 RepID=UPI000DA2903E|nr:ERF family protein [Clostridium perfringens]SQI03732.1 phage essential recombination function protein [Clostridium perfringens]